MAKIWMIISSFYPAIGGAEQQAQLLAKGLLAAGWEVSILTRRHGGHYPDLTLSDEVGGVKVRRVFSQAPAKFAALLFVLAGLGHLLGQDRRQIYHAHALGAPAIMAALAKLLFGGVCVVKLRAGRNSYHQQLQSWPGRLQLWFLRQVADRFVANNREALEMLRELKFPPRQVAYIPNGVDTDHFRPAHKQDARRRLGLPIERAVVLYVGRLAHVKGVDVLIQAWCRLPEQVRFRGLLVIVGDGEERYKLEQYVRQRGLDETVVFRGQQEDVLDYLHAADVVVLPSRSEGMPNTLLEAMACGLPTVSSAVGGIPDVVTNNVNGLTVGPEDVDGLATALVDLLGQSESDRQRLGDAARETVERRFSLQSVVRQYLELYQTLIRET